MAEFERLHAGNSEVQEKQAIAFQFAQTATVGLAVTGVLGGLMVTQTTTASGSVVIGTGAGVVGSTVGAGASEAINPGDVTFNVLTANPVGGLPRNDIIVWDSTTKAFAVVVGTPNATPSDPSVANTKLPLARLRHAASAVTIPLAKIDDLRVFTGMRGTPIPVHNVTERNALAAYDGLQVYRLDLHYTETYNGATSAWLPDVETFRNGDTTAICGSSPATTTRKVRQEFSVWVTTSFYGEFSIVWPTPFAHGITSVSITVGDAVGLAPVAYVVPAVPINLTGFEAWAGKTDGGALSYGGCRVNVVGVGW